MPKITQRELIKKYLKYNKDFIPAIRANSEYIEGYTKMGWFGSEIGRVCREMRKEGELVSKKNDKGYEVFNYPIKGQQTLL